MGDEAVMYKVIGDEQVYWGELSQCESCGGNVVVNQLQVMPPIPEGIPIQEFSEENRPVEIIVDEYGEYTCERCQV